MDAIPLIFSSGWASGINGYAVVFIMGLLGRLTDTGSVPHVLERTDVLIASGLFALLDIVADKIPYVDSLWDAIHTVIRPVIGGALGALVAGDAGTLGEAAGAAVGSTSALASHAVKASLRAAVNTSPEPASNVAVSTAEDFSLAAVVALSIEHPIPAAIIAATLLLTAALLTWWLIRKFRRWRQSWRLPRFLQADPPGGTATGTATAVESARLEAAPARAVSKSSATAAGGTTAKNRRKSHTSISNQSKHP